MQILNLEGKATLVRINEFGLPSAIKVNVRFAVVDAGKLVVHCVVKGCRNPTTYRVPVTAEVSLYAGWHDVERNDIEQTSIFVPIGVSFKSDQFARMTRQIADAPVWTSGVSK